MKLMIVGAFCPATTSTKKRIMEKKARFLEEQADQHENLMHFHHQDLVGAG
jgi:hypothetical protein